MRGLPSILVGLLVGLLLGAELSADVVGLARVGVFWPDPNLMKLRVVEAFR